MFSEGFKKLLRFLGMAIITFAIFFILILLSGLGFSLSNDWKEFGHSYKYELLIGLPLLLTLFMFIFFGKWWTLVLSSTMYDPKPSEEDLREPNKPQS